MDRYKISQSNIKQQLGKPIKSVWSSPNRIKSINSKQALALIGGALVLIAVGILIGIIFFGSSHKPSQTEPSSSLTAASKTNTVISTSAYNALTTGVSILGSYCAPKVHVEIVESGVNETIDCKLAASLIDGAIENAKNPWNFHLPESDISAWQTGPYGQELSGTNIVGESANGEIISIGFNNGGQVTTVIVVPVGLLAPASATSNASNTSGSSTGTTPKGSNTSNLPPGNPIPTGAID
jgi:hypothetical protein